jgi:hypothetical protein
LPSSVCFAVIWTGAATRAGERASVIFGATRAPVTALLAENVREAILV